MGDVIGDLNSRRGIVQEFTDKPGGMKVRGVDCVPGAGLAAGLHSNCGWQGFRLSASGIRLRSGEGGRPAS
jgi:hypothetical protein